MSGHEKDQSDLRLVREYSDVKRQLAGLSETLEHYGQELAVVAEFLSSAAFTNAHNLLRAQRVDGIDLGRLKALLDEEQQLDAKAKTCRDRLHSAGLNLE